MTVPVILDASGAPISPAEIRRQRFLAARSAHEAAATDHQDLVSWLPAGMSGQAAMTFERDLISARVHDIARNDGWASAGMDRHVDALIGGGWRLSAKPNARALGIEQEAADDFADALEAEWRDYATDPRFHCDVERSRPMAGNLALACRHRFLDGEALGVIYFIDSGGPYRTAVNVIDPDRLSTPMGRTDSVTLQSGVELDENGAPIAYHIQSSHPGDIYYPGSKLHNWERIERETEWGRPVVVHAFDPKRAGEKRGLSTLSPILRKLKQITRYDEAELQAATLNAILAAFVTSPFDHETMADVLGAGTLDQYSAERLAFHKEAPIRFPGAQVGFLYPGENVNLTKPSHPNSVFEAFERQALRNVSSAIGLSYEQLTMDWSQVNYSSARAALLEVWRGLTSRKASFAAQFMQPIYMAWLEEAIETGRVALPSGAPEFLDRRAAYCHAEWIGPGRGWVDPQKEADAAVTRLDAGISTLERECAEQGLDWREVLAQKAREKREMERLNLDPSQPLRPVLSRSPAPADDSEAEEQV